MQKEKQLEKKSEIYNPDSYLDKEGLLKVAERLKKSNLHFNEMTLFLSATKAKHQP